jgi:RNA polymerase sigma-70 factor (ECF subfamily)
LESALSSQDAELDVEAIYRAHGRFMWASLHRVGVREADLPDALQEALVVVHRRLHTYDREAKLTSWLFGICLRVGAAQRRRAHHRREELRADARMEHEASDRPTPEDEALTNDARRRLNMVLDGMDGEKRAVLVMFEIEGLSCAQIAEMLDVPVGTIHSRLFAARKAFEQSLARVNAQSRYREARARGASQ